METSRRRRLYRLLLILLPVIAATATCASVFLYHPINMKVEPQKSPIRFAYGGNANQFDIGSGKTISVELIGYTQASITLHPTNGSTYYKDVLRVENTDSKAYNVYVVIVDPLAWNNDYNASLLVFYSDATRYLNFDANGRVTSVDGCACCVDLTGTRGDLSDSFLIDSGDTIDLDLYFYVPHNAAPPSDNNVNFLLVYTPSSEEPPS
ncbi:MAG: hypothetical protein QFX33_02515 [Candidatus Nezhaarchaeota archaeon]|nr:hypothetical protein [Candidatus Nezhaarchaeota archaeon]